MSQTSEILFEYLRDILYHPSKASLDLEKLDRDFINLGKGLMFLAHCLLQFNEFARGLAEGDLSVAFPSSDNELAAPLKSLHASLSHLTWQSQQVAKGDYKQRVDFMGDFANAFNTMIEQLSERQQKLESEIEQSHNMTVALEQINRLLTNITQHIPQQIIVLDRYTHGLLFVNDSAQHMIDTNEGYVDILIEKILEHNKQDDRYNVEIELGQGEKAKYLAVNSYLIEWEKSHAEAFVVNDISVEKNQIKMLEGYAYRDSLTNLYNRFYGMMMLNRWLEEQKCFVLVFADLDNLKYINDRFGHHDGDKYITNAAKHLQSFSQDAVVCRLGGDEFMLLSPDIGLDDANERMNRVCLDLQNDKYLIGKEYFYRISFGVVGVGEDNKLPASDILSLADEKMYEHKRKRKKEGLNIARHTQQTADA